MATLGIPKLQKLDDNKTVNQTLHNSKCTHVTQNRNWTSTTKMRLPDYLHALLLSHTHTLYPRTCHMGGTGDQRDIHTYMPEHHPVRRGIQGSAAWAKPLRMRRGRALPCRQRRARPHITLCQRHANALQRKKETLSMTLSYILFFSASDLHSLTPCLKG